MHYILAAVAFAITFTGCASNNITVTVSFSESKDCEICSCCIQDLTYLDDHMYSRPNFGRAQTCVDHCVECYAVGRFDYIDGTMSDSLIVDLK